MLAAGAAIGLVVGLALGSLGGGGSILTVPALVYLLGQEPRQATTASLVVVGVGALMGAAGHVRDREVRLGQGLTFGALGVAGAYAGSRLSAGVAPELLMGLFAALMLLVAGLMTQRRHAEARGQARSETGNGADASAPPALVPVVTFRPVLRCRCARAVAVVATAAAVGLLTGFFGVGGGFAVVPALVLVLGLPMREAVGTSLVVIAVNSAAALTTRLGSGLALDGPLVATLAVAAVAGSLLGARLGHRVPSRHLSLGFTVLLVVVAAYAGGRSVLALA